MLISDLKNNLIGTLHGGTLNKVRNIEWAFERAANTMLMNLDPLETMRTAPLQNLVHDDLQNYPLASDFKKLVDLIPEQNRNLWDKATRVGSKYFSVNLAARNNLISIEDNEGSKFIRINWKARQGKTLNTMDSLTANGAWVVTGAASGLSLQTIYHVSGTASIEFDVTATGGGIQNTSMAAVDLTAEDEIADLIFPIYFGSVANLTSVTPTWGNDLTLNFWTGAAQTTQADGTPFAPGWNYIRASWSAATETGTVNPATVDSFKLTIQSTGAIANVRVDNLIFSIGRPFDHKYYSKYLLRNTAGVWITRTTDDLDTIVLDNNGIQIYILECHIACAQQVEGADSGFDIGWAKKELNGDPSAVDPVKRMGLYQKYRKENPSQSQKKIGYYGSKPARGRFGNGRAMGYSRF